MTHEDLIAAVHDNAQRCKSNTHRIDELKERQDKLDDLVASMSTIADRQSHMEGELAEIKQDVRTIVSKPAKRWDAVVDRIIMLIIGAACTYLLTRLGL